jgi:hypothetical protein
LLLHHLKSTQKFLQSNKAQATQLHPIPIEASSETQLFEAPPLTGTDFHSMKTTFGLSFNHLIGKIIHISIISHPDLSYACMRFLDTWPVQIILFLKFSIISYLVLLLPPFTSSSKQTTPTGNTLQTFWLKGTVEYIHSDYGNNKQPSHMPTMLAVFVLTTPYQATSLSTTAFLFPGLAKSNPLLPSTPWAVASLYMKTTKVLSNSYVPIDQLIPSITTP